MLQIYDTRLDFPVIVQSDGYLYPNNNQSQRETHFHFKNKVNPNSSFADHILLLVFVQCNREVPRGVRNSKVWRQDKFRRDWSRL